MRVNDDAFGTINVGEKHLEIDSAAQKLDWAGLSDTEAFAELRALPEQDKRTLFASCVARMLKGQLARISQTHLGGVSSGADEPGLWQHLCGVETVWAGVDRMPSLRKITSRHGRSRARAGTWRGGGA